MKKLAVNGKRSAVAWRSFLTLCLLLTACCSLNCGSVPNLDPPECAAARQTVKEFYSYHFANDMRFTPENLAKREKFLTPEYFKSLKPLASEIDVFTTNNTDFAKAFRVGGCQVKEPTKTDIEVLLFWKDENRSEQKAIHAEVVKQGDKWLINKILN